MSSQDDNKISASVVEAIHNGNLESLKQLLDKSHEIIKKTIDGKRTLLHVATDWPGHFPNNAATVAVLLEHGADVNAAYAGQEHSETPLHWAASTDDIAVLDTLLDHGADIEAPGSVIGGGPALSDAVAFGQWHAARRLVERGARTTLWQAAALGLIDRLKEYFCGDTPPSQDDITNAFWSACHGGQQIAAAYLLDRGADLNWIGYNELTPLDAANRSGAKELVEWLRSRGARSAKS